MTFSGTRPAVLSGIGFAEQKEANLSGSSRTRGEGSSGYSPWPWPGYGFAIGFTLATARRSEGFNSFAQHVQAGRLDP
jgi:hypothetical protein